jgi:hypothetical protein
MEHFNSFGSSCGARAAGGQRTGRPDESPGLRVSAEGAKVRDWLLPGVREEGGEGASSAPLLPFFLELGISE